MLHVAGHADGDDVFARVGRQHPEGGETQCAIRRQGPLGEGERRDRDDQGDRADCQIGRRGTRRASIARPGTRSGCWRRRAAPREAAIITSGRNTAQLAVVKPKGKTLSTNAPRARAMRLVATLSVSCFGSARSFEPKAAATTAYPGRKRASGSAAASRTISNGTSAATRAQATAAAQTSSRSRCPLMAGP